MNKKSMEWQIGKIILALIVLLAVLLIIHELGVRMDYLWEKIKDILQFGG